LKSLQFEEELQKWEIEFKKGFSKPLILLSLAEKPNYPYQVTKEIIRETKGKIIFGGSKIYPILKKMEDDGLILGKKDENSMKRTYTITDNGEHFLASLKQTMKEFVEIVHKMIDD
jgi:PadR family transcriptional regulator PadR